MAGIDSCCETCDVSCQLLCCYSVDLAERDQMISRFSSPVAFSCAPVMELLFEIGIRKHDQARSHDFSCQ